MKHFLIAGLDFGTSCSKVVLRDQLTGLAKAVTFGKEAIGLLPSRIHISGGDLCGPLSPGETTLTYPKLVAADCASGSSQFFPVYRADLRALSSLLGIPALPEFATLVLARYFLSVLQGISDFLRADSDWNTFESSRDAFITQLAVPSGLMGTNDRKVESLMLEALSIATYLWRKGGASDASTIDELRGAKSAVHRLSSQDRESLLEACVTYPEVAAGVQTIFRSQNTPDGKYVTMDVGAGTVDLNAFYRRSASDQSEDPMDPGLDYWACKVEPLGAARLEIPREQNSQAGIKRMSSGELADRLAKTVNDLMRNALRYQPNRVHGNGGNPWSRNTHVYIWGGGAAVSTYGQTLAETLRAHGIQVDEPNQLPKPTEQFLLPYDVSSFGRLAIAYGLSFHRANLEEIRLPHEISSFEQLFSSIWDEIAETPSACSCFANPDCFRCGGTGFITRRADHPRPASGANSFTANRADETPRVSTPRPVPRPRRASDAENAFAACLRNYQLATRSGRRILVAQRMLMLNEIFRFSKRPDTQINPQLLHAAQNILLQNPGQFGGKVRIQALSAELTALAVRAVIILPRPIGKIDLELDASNRFEFEKAINSSDQPYLDVGCGLKRASNGEFRLSVTSLKPKAQRPDIRTS